MRLIPITTCVALIACFVLPHSVFAQGAQPDSLVRVSVPYRPIEPQQDQGGTGGGGGSGMADDYCPWAYLFSTDSIHFYRLRKCTTAFFAYEGFENAVSPLGCNQDASCKCGCMPNNGFSPDYADETTQFTQQAGATDMMYGDPYDAAGPPLAEQQRAVKVTFPDMTTEWFRLVKVELEATGEWKWYGVPTEAQALKDIAIMADMAVASVPATPKTWWVSFDGNSAWVRRK